ncbi:MAG: bifunctional precorrin-2 dehydrogenase/sirohydrochlorin ferrochelatase [Chloroflexi bacterium]|nr:bifunctional precorrin-2 dehydrogenase/sirohydrochlorin ferrochelatase [Chloroflexota bacterium]
MPKYYPVFLNLAGKPAVVLCGGREAERKVAGLLASGARVTLINPELTPELERLAGEGAIAVERRGYLSGDLRGAYLAIVGTEDRELNHRAATEARQEGALVNTVDDVPYCDFIAPATIERGDLTVAVSTNGKSPAMARRMREELEAYLTPDYGDLLQVLERVRSRLLRRKVRPRPDAWQEGMDPAFRALVRQGALSEAQERLFQDLVRAAAQDWRLKSDAAGWCTKIVEAAARQSPSDGVPQRQGAPA